MSRYRATALIIRAGNVLLVRDKGRKDFSMPGGGFKPHESTIQAGTREVNEELHLATVSAKRLRRCDLDGKRANHKVVLLETTGIPRLNTRELAEYIWWDMKKPVPIQNHVKYILSKFQGR